MAAGASTLPTVPATAPPPRLLITAGPTHEPIDAVRYLANRSSGRVGVSIAKAAAELGCTTQLLLGPICESDLEAVSPHLRVSRFRTARELERLLGEFMPTSDILIMAAAVADYRPKNPRETGKLRRTNSDLHLELESVPDLLRGVAGRRQPGQTLVGFALEPAEGLREAAEAKLQAKGIDLIVGNALETMDAGGIDAVLIGRDGLIDGTPGRIAKNEFGRWLVDRVLKHAATGDRR